MRFRATVQVYPGEKKHASEGIFTANIYAQVPELISQPRRWLNGSFFAAIHSTFHFYYIYRSSHTVVRKFWIHVEMFYQFLNLVFGLYRFLVLSGLTFFLILLFR
jgi:cellulose synthase/poly-beta-1,6-N-acetylglucosamine synthase-like glycosyltransferase